MPHQRHIVDVAFELDPATGLPAYDQVIVIGPRQATGKTELMLPVMTHRCVGFDRALAQWVRSELGVDVPYPGPQRVLYTAQTADNAREKWRDVHVARLKDSPFFKPRPQFSARLRLNAEAMAWNRTRSMWLPGSTTGKTGGTGDSLDLGVIDEAWSREDFRTELGMRPAMMTRPWRQLWIVSMIPGPSRVKPDEWPFLRKKRELGRLLVESGQRSGTAIFDFCAPSGLDPSDPATWYTALPGLGRTVSERVVRADLENPGFPLADFCAEYLGWPDDEVGGGWRVISEQEWTDHARPGEEMAGQVALGVWVPPDRGWACVAAAGMRRWRGKLVEITGSASRNEWDYRRGTGWVLPRLKDLDARQQPVVIVTNDRALWDQAEREGLKVHRAQAGDIASGAAMLFDGVSGADEAGRDVFHLDQREAGVAVRAAVKRTQGQAWVWDSDHEEVDVSPVGAFSLALWGLSTPRVHVERPVPAGRPRMRWLS
jgi:hypothetical protein